MCVSAWLLKTQAMFIKTSRRGWSSLLLCWLIGLVSCTALSHAGEKPIPGLGPYITNGSYAVQLDGDVIRSHNLEQKFIPASTIKILTALMALEILGPDFRFSTMIYLDDANRLYIQGGGDPLLTSEKITEIGLGLKMQGIRELEQIILDDTAFRLEGPPAGSENSHNPYDAESGALAVNFNALPFKVLKNRSITPLEKQTPLLPIMTEIGRSLPPGDHRVNVSAFPQRLSHSNMLRYTGELFTAIFKREGIDLKIPYSVGPRPSSARLIHVYQSDKPVAEIVRLNLHYSSNFLANQLYLACGAQIFGAPATWKKACDMAQKYLQLKFNMQPGDIDLVDGSGLSRDNRISAQKMLEILGRFAPYAQLMKKRDGIYLKSGTLTGTYSYVGYFDSGDRLIPFVLFLNQIPNTRQEALKIMKREIDALLPPT